MVPFKVAFKIEDNLELSFNAKKVMMIKVGNSSVSYFWSNTRSFDRGTLGCKYLENGVLIRFNNSGMNAPGPVPSY